MSEERNAKRAITMKEQIGQVLSESPVDPGHVILGEADPFISGLG